ncbi:hypothetical protein ACFOG5_14540 [Pedobacter fastidiosus]|uniref:hypothetical protein n=1 Tax=Pedobacter fastidiosus TaxID=2765361 RepID=UPI00361FD181
MRRNFRNLGLYLALQMVLFVVKSTIGTIFLFISCLVQALLSSLRDDCWVEKMFQHIFVPSERLIINALQP